MPRVVNEAEYASRRNEILNVAQRLIYTRGYDNMTVQDILQALGISKGAFYHYFDSKQAVLEALVDRMQQEAEKALNPIVEDSTLPVLLKLERYFATVVSWKTVRKDQLLPLLHVWYTDENALVRQKLEFRTLHWFTAVFTDMVLQGTREGVIHAPFPEQTSEVVVKMMVSLGETIAALFLSLEQAGDEASRQCIARRLQETNTAYQAAIERVLGLPDGSLPLFDIETLIEWTNPV